MRVKKIIDKYLIESGLYNTDLEVDGYLIEGIERNESFWTNEEPKEIIKLEKTTRVISYGELTPEEYPEQLEKAKGNYSYDWNSDIKFDSLDDEFVYKKFLEEHKPVIEQYTKRTPIDFTVVEITGRTDNKFITPYRFLRKENHQVNDSLYEYIPEPMEMAREIANEYGFVEVEDGKETKGLYWSVPNHSKDTLRFLKINGLYSHSKLPQWRNEPKFAGISAGTWEECEKAYKVHVRLIDCVFKEAKTIYLAQGVGIDLAKVTEKLQYFTNLVGRIDAKSRSEVNPRTVQNLILEFKQELLNGIKDV